MYQADAEGREKSRWETQRLVVQGRLRACVFATWLLQGDEGNRAEGEI